MRRALLVAFLLSGVVAGYGSAVARALGYDGLHASCPHDGAKP
ncbi:MAG: hypothetical protein V4850_22370 [Myxococcota bacterium]